jgi:hypothetical protein
MTGTLLDDLPPPFITTNASHKATRHAKFTPNLIAWANGLPDKSDSFVSKFRCL